MVGWVGWADTGMGWWASKQPRIEWTRSWAGGREQGKLAPKGLVMPVTENLQWWQGWGFNRFGSTRDDKAVVTGVVADGVRPPADPRKARRG